MTSKNLLAFGLRSQLIRNSRRPSFSPPSRNATKRPYELEYLSSIIGSREMVGFGINGQPCYADLTAFPFPAIRYKEDTPDIMALREKEKGDWRHLTKEEKRNLYRSQFCQTFPEFKHVSTEWMAVIGYTLMYISAGIWLFIGMRSLVYAPPPVTFNYERKMAQLQRMIDLRVNPITGLASKWDYDKNEWKKKGYLPNPYKDDDDEECEEVEEL